MLPIQPSRHCSRDEELAAICVWPSIRHGEQILLVVGQLEVLVREFLAVDRLSAGTVAAGEVAALKHEAGDDAVEGAALEAEAFLAGAEGFEVLGGFWNDIIVKNEVDTASLWGCVVRFGVLNVEEDVLRHVG